MLKQSILVIMASFIVILFLTQISYVTLLLVQMHYVVAKELAAVFAGGEIGNFIRDTLALFLIPFFIAGIPALIYWATTRTQFVYYTHILWISWLMMATVLIAK